MAVATSPAHRTAFKTTTSPARRDAKPAQIEHPILFQKFFKSVGPRTYAAQIKKASNSNHYLVLTEGRRDEKTGEVYKKRLNVFSEDFEAFLSLIRDIAVFNKANPVPETVRQRQAALWKKRQSKSAPQPLR